MMVGESRQEEATVVRKKSKTSLFACSLVLLLILNIQLFSARTVMAQSEDTYNPIAYNLRSGTSHISGQLTDVQFDDGNYIVFESYYTGIDTMKSVDSNRSDVDSSTSKGTHNSFSAQQYGPDSIYDTLTEENTASGASNTTLINAESFEGTWPPIGWTETGAWNRESNQAYGGIYSADFDGPAFGSASGDLDTPDLNCFDATAIYVSFYFREDVGLAAEFQLRFWNGLTWVNIEYLGGYSLGWHHWEMKITNSQYFKSDFKIRWRADAVDNGENAYVDLVTVKKEVEMDNYELDLEVQWTNANYDETNEELAIYADKGKNTHSLNLSSGYMMVGDGTPNWGSTAGTISFWICWDTIGNRPWGQNNDMETRFSASSLVIDWGYANSLISNASFASARWYFIAIVWNENDDELCLYIGDQENLPVLDAYSDTWTSVVSTVGVTENNFMASRGGIGPTDGLGDDLRYWDISRNLTELQSDYNTELTGSELNLASYFKLNGNFDDVGLDSNNGTGLGTYSFSSDVPFDKAPTENIQVDVWFGGSWQTLLTNLEIGWNNISVSPYLDSPIFTIRFRGGIEALDKDQDRWRIDSTSLHVWSNQYQAEVEFSGSSTQQDLSQLTWTVISAWTTDSLNVTLQLYNYSLGSYVSNGIGSLIYTSSTLPEEDETKNQTIIINPTHFRNATGHWKMKIKGVKATDSRFELKIDLIRYEVEVGISIPPQFFDWTTAIFLTILVLGVILPLTIRLKRKSKSEKSTPRIHTFDEQPVMYPERIIGRKTLLIVDHASGFYQALINFISEAMTNNESLFVFTSRNSLLHTALSGEKVKFYLLSPKISSLKHINKKKTLVPMRDLSVLLDTITKTWKKGIRKPRTIIFDNLSDTILMCGFEKTYKFMRFLLESKSSPKVTALFIFNPAAHDSAMSSSIRSLFQFRSANLGGKSRDQP